MDFLTKLRDLPRRYLLSDGNFDYARAAEDLGIRTDEEWGRFLLQLYRLDVAVKHHVDKRLLYFLLGEQVKGKLPVLEVPPAEPWAWSQADAYCAGCPGSEMVDVPTGGRFPRCGNPDRLEKWESCLKYREELRAAVAPPERPRGEPAPNLIVEELIADHERRCDELIQDLSKEIP